MKKDILANMVVMIRPKAFGFNPETATSNAFQKMAEGLTATEINEIAGEEFDAFAIKLATAGIEVIVFDDTEMPKTPDAVFPNNWFCTHPQGPIMTFPMESKIRRRERRHDILRYIQSKTGTSLDRSLEQEENAGRYLEGTGSLVLDHQNRLAYAGISTRTYIGALEKYQQLSGYQTVPFKAYGPDGHPIYHTNVMMCLGPDFAIIGADTINAGDRGKILELLEKSGKRILRLSNEQVYKHFAGNMLCLASKSDQRILVMSETALTSLTNRQRKAIEQDFMCQIVSGSITTIECLGGGSVRCMLAEIFI